MIGVILLFVGAVLLVNGIWLLGHIASREVAIMNVFTGVVAFIVAVLGLIDQNLELAAYPLLFAFTYLWVAYNQYINADGVGLGWYCLFVAITAVPISVITFVYADTVFLVWMGFNWAAWAVLWFLYFLLLAAKKPIQRLAAYVTIVVAIGTAWIPGFLVINDYI